MKFVTTSFLLKIKPKYFHVFLGHKTGPPMGVRSRGGGLKLP